MTRPATPPPPPPHSVAERGPRTAAGRALSKAWRVRNTESPGLEEAWPEQFDRYILAIEAEATAALPLDASNVREAIAAALEATLGPPADGISTAYRRAIVDYAIARLSAATGDEVGEP